jgi:ribonucleoside-diphosphate reductase alpha chain
MMAATQPFLSGAISKTVNLPNDCSVEDIAEAYTESWRQGLKAVAIYRDGSKGTQPLNVTAQTDADKKGTAIDPNKKEATTAGAPGLASETWVKEAAALTAALAASQAESSAAKSALAAAEAQLAALTATATAASDNLDAQAPPRAVRHRLPAERASITHKFGIAGHEGYITVGLYPNGAPGEIFIRMAKEGSTISGLMDSFATAVSLSLQHGVPLKVLCEKFAHTRFEPSGWTGNEQIGYAKSIMDYLFRWMQLRFLSGTQLDLFAGLNKPAESAQPAAIPSLTASASSAVILSEAKDPGISAGPATIADPWSNEPGAPLHADRTPPQQGIAPEPTATPSSTPYSLLPNPSTIEDRGIIHASDAMKGMYDMGDAPSCSTCGAIMVRNGACHRCMECGSTSGCS